MQVLVSAVSRAAARNTSPETGLFIQTSEGITPNWKALHAFHLRGSRSPHRSTRQRAWHARQATLIAERHLDAPAKAWTWSAAIAYALEGIREDASPLT